MTGNRVYNNASTSGILISGGNADVDITLNEVYGNGYWGIQCTTIASYVADILYNDVHGNGYSGLYINTGNGANVNYNNFYGNGVAGVANYNYAVQNPSVNSVNARYNWWGDTVVTAEMDSRRQPEEHRPDLRCVRQCVLWHGGLCGLAERGGGAAVAGVVEDHVAAGRGGAEDGRAAYPGRLPWRRPGVKQVEVSLDGGISWQEATGTGSWSLRLDAPGGRHVHHFIAGHRRRRQHRNARCGYHDHDRQHLADHLGVADVDETWSGTVTLTGDITVPDGVTLTIEPGTQVRAMALNDDQGGGS